MSLKIPQYQFIRSNFSIKYMKFQLKNITFMNMKCIYCRLTTFPKTRGFIKTDSVRDVARSGVDLINFCFEKVPRFRKILETTSIGPSSVLMREH